MQKIQNLKKKIVEISKNHDDSNNSNSISIDEFQNISLFDDFIFEISISSFAISQQNENTIFEIREKLNENELTNDTFVSSTSSTSTRKKRNKTFLLSFSNRDFRLKIDAIARSNYYKTNNFDIKRIKNIKKLKKFVNVVNNVYRIKQMFKIHIHMIRVFHVLQSDKNFDFDHVFKSINYKKVFKFFY